MDPSLEISINLSKPEKNNKDIAKLVSAVSSSYPKCLLCHENLGFAGNESKPARGRTSVSSP
jgi:UDPglucose--hexose-1-phosphate uridylyltransferase